MPAPAGTEWRIVAGYNTGGHVGIDPHAIDIVRDDALTAGTPVLSPITGTVTWLSGSCVTLSAGDGFAVLLCHIFPTSGLQAGAPVVVGQIIGAVAPAGFAENNGLAHIHMAVHRTLGDGQLQSTVPFTGAYALEGRELPATDASHAYFGETFISTNSVKVQESVTDPAEPEEVSPDKTQEAAPAEPEAAPAEPEAPPPPPPEPQFLHPGWNLVGWTGNTAIGEAVAPLAGSIDVVFAYDAAAQSFRRYAPDGSPQTNTLTTLQAGDGLLVHVTAPDGVEWFPPRVAQSQVVALTAGWNLVAWTGPRQAVGQAVIGLAEVLLGVYALDGESQQYHVYRPQGLEFLSDLEILEPGQGVWVQVRGATLWTPVESALASQLQAVVLGPGCLNIRPAPTTKNAPPLACLPEGTVVEPTGETALDANGDTWLYVRSDIYVGWVFAEFIAAFAVGDTIAGSASFYHPGLLGRPMYCGGAYDRLDPTIAAATAWPCGTHLRVWRGDRSVDVVVRDTGQLAPNRLDLSEAAFLQLGQLAEGVIPVRIEVLSAPATE